MSMSSGGGNGAGQRGGAPRDHPHVGRGLVLVVAAVVLGALLLPSATRGPLAASAVSATTTTTSAGAGAPGTGHGRHSSTTTSTTVAPSAIHVLVANATSTNGVAGAVTSFLASKGFATLTAVNALVKANATEVFTVGGATADVGPVTGALNLPPASIEPAAEAAPVASTTGADVVVIAGPDLASRFAPGGATATTQSAG